MGPLARVAELDNKYPLEVFGTRNPNAPAGTNAEISVHLLDDPAE